MVLLLGLTMFLFIYACARNVESDMFLLFLIVNCSDCGVFILSHMEDISENIPMMKNFNMDLLKLSLFMSLSNHGLT